MADYRRELARFPPISKSPEQPVHEAKDGGLYLAIPVGKAVYVWFTYCKAKNICFIVDGGSIHPVHAAFSSKLALGTVLGGVLLHHAGKRCFVAETIYYNQGQVVKGSLLDRQPIVEEVLRLVDNRLHLPSQVMILRPTRSHFPFFDAVYPVQCVKCLHGAAVTVVDDVKMIFSIRALEKSDTYELNNGDLACIDTYARSVMMNALFRACPENRDLDAAEDSDNEVDIDDRPIVMECRWHKRGWVPVRPV